MGTLCCFMVSKGPLPMGASWVSYHVQTNRPRAAAGLGGSSGPMHNIARRRLFFTRGVCFVLVEIRKYVCPYSAERALLQQPRLGRSGELAAATHTTRTYIPKNYRLTNYSLTPRVVGC